MRHLVEQIQTLEARLREGGGPARIARQHEAGKMTARERITGLTDAGSILLFGGGVKKGFVYGKTADERPCTTIENPLPLEDLHATIYRALGIAPDQYFLNEKRPVYVTKDGKGKVASEVYA